MIMAVLDRSKRNQDVVLCWNEELLSKCGFVYSGNLIKVTFYIINEFILWLDDDDHFFVKAVLLHLDHDVGLGCSEYLGSALLPQIVC